MMSADNLSSFRSRKTQFYLMYFCMLLQANILLQYLPSYSKAVGVGVTVGGDSQFPSPKVCKKIHSLQFRPWGEFHIHHFSACPPQDSHSNIILKQWIQSFFSFSKTISTMYIYIFHIHFHLFQINVQTILNSLISLTDLMKYIL